MKGRKQRRRSSLRRMQRSTARGSSWRRRRPPQSAACTCPSGYIFPVSATRQCFANKRGGGRRLPSAAEASAAAPTLVTVRRNCSRTELHRTLRARTPAACSKSTAVCRLAQTRDQHVVRRRSCAQGWAPAPARRAQCCKRRRRFVKRRSSAPMLLKREHCMAPLHCL